VKRVALHVSGKCREVSHSEYNKTPEAIYQIPHISHGLPCHWFGKTESDANCWCTKNSHKIFNKYNQL